LGNTGADLFGCQNCGEVFVILDTAALPDSICVLDTQPRRIIGTGKNTWYGIDLGLADLTGDSRDEVIVVGRGDYESPTSIDQTAIVYGAAIPADSVLISTDTTITRVRGPAHGVDLGRGLTASDFNGDGVADLALGAHGFQGNTGRTYVFFGCPTVSDTNEASPPSFALRQNYPNPFNPRTTIAYSLPQRSRVQLSIYGVDGRRITGLVDGTQGPGDYSIEWDGRDDRGGAVASGVYFCRLTADGLSSSIKLVLLR
jgi:hypothetical protein